MEEVGESRGGRLSEGVILTRLSEEKDVPLDCASGSVSGAKPHVTFYDAGRRRGGAMMSSPLVNGSSQTETPFQFPFIVLLHGRGAIFNFQLSSSSPPSTSILVANFIPLQLQSSLKTSSLVADFNTRRRQLQPSSPFKFQTPSLCYFLPFSLMPSVFLMLLLRDELLNKIIIHSIKDETVFYFLNFAIKSVAPSGASATPMRYYCTCCYVIFVRRARIAMSGRALSGASARTIIRRH
jgi:hypothetical protein